MTELELLREWERMQRRMDKLLTLKDFNPKLYSEVKAEKEKVVKQLDEMRTHG